MKITMKFFSKFFRILLSFYKKIEWDGLLLISLVLLSPFLAFYNLELNPRPWQDEGSYLTLAKTLAEDGVYAVRSSDGYQSFGAVQSVGPTVTLPVAWMFRVFGVGLLNGRLVSAGYMLITLWLFYFVARSLFGSKVAVVAVLLLIVSPAVKYLLYSRPLLGEAPALGYFLAGWLLWSCGVRRRLLWLQILSGLCFGAAIITKSQYLLIGFASIGFMFILDILYYRLGHYKDLIVIGFVACCCVVAWYWWQIDYFGTQTFKENLSKMGELASITTGFNIHSSIEAARYLFGSGSGYLYIFWGFPALIYCGVLASRQTVESYLIAFLVVFTSIWLAYFTFFTIPWSRYIFPPAAILAMFVGKLFLDLFLVFRSSINTFWLDIKGFVLRGSSLSPAGMMGVGSFLSMFILILWSGYHLQKTIRDDVLDKIGHEDITVYSPPQFSAPQELAIYLNEFISRDSVIDTWERELGILTEHKYHYPDQSLLAQSHKIVYRDVAGATKYAILGRDYFETIQPDYVIVGWYSRNDHIYDVEYLLQHGTLIKTIGDNVWGYELYKLNRP